jgi:hypothetical protein
MSGCNSRQPHQSIIEEGSIKNEKATRAGRQLAQLSLQNSMGLGQHQDGAPVFFIPVSLLFIFFLESWQTSNALALQTSRCGSVIHNRSGDSYHRLAPHGCVANLSAILRKIAVTSGVKKEALSGKRRQRIKKLCRILITLYSRYMRE